MTKRAKTHRITIVARFDTVLTAKEAKYALWNSIGGLEMYGEGRQTREDRALGYRSAEPFGEGILRVPGFRNPPKF